MNLFTETVLTISCILIKNGVTNDITRNILKFLDIKESIKKDYVNNMINKHIHDGYSYFAVHLNKIPYFNLNNGNRIKYRNWIVSLINEKSMDIEKHKYKYIFSHYIRNGTGIVIKKFPEGEPIKTYLTCWY